MSARTAEAYRQPLFGRRDDLFNRCLLWTSVVGALLTIAIFLAPARRQLITDVSQLPKRFARLLLEEAKPVPAAEVVQPEASEPAEEPKPAPLPEPRARSEARQLPADAGRAGRQRAEEVRAELAATSASLQSTLDDLSSSLQSSKSASSMPTRSRRSRSVRSGRTATDMPSVAAGLGGGSSADLSGSAVKGSRVAIGTLGLGGGGGGGSGSSASGSAGGTGSGAAPGVYRSNASLLAVIQKYSAGIHYCYANELKHDEGLRGKLVVAMTVSASGDVVEATIVENSLGSKRLADCALSQIRDWKFPPIEKGLTSFQAPFVFTPPK